MGFLPHLRACRDLRGDFGAERAGEARDRDHVRPGAVAH